MNRTDKATYRLGLKLWKKKLSIAEKLLYVDNCPVCSSATTKCSECPANDHENRNLRTCAQMKIVNAHIGDTYTEINRVVAALEREHAKLKI